MQVELELALVLQTKRTEIARDWQGDARARWPGRPRAEFGRGSEVFSAVVDLLSGLEYSIRESLCDTNTATGLSRFNATGPAAEAALKLAALPYSFADSECMLQLLSMRVAGAVERAGLPPHARDIAAIAFAGISEAAARFRIVNAEKALATNREQEVLNQHMAGRFISNASHELRTPLTAILGFAELLLEESYGPLAEEQKEVLGHINNSGQNLLEIVNNLIDIMQIQAGKFTLRCRRAEIAPLLASICELLRGLAERRSVVFECELSDELGAMNMDENIVRHIVYHLLSSSLRSTPAGGAVRLGVERTSNSVTIITEDTALNLPQEAIENMLGTVPLLENSPVRGYEGWEVGLALVRRYVELHEGSIEIHNRDAQGTIFRVTLPAGLQAHSAPAPVC